MQAIILQTSSIGTVQDNLWAIYVYQDETLNLLSNVNCIKVQFYGTVSAMILNAASEE